tara:strand:- start:6253 stop:7686 length:1434 start_codon:yes stop_codon:yes gene_type:complete
MSAVREFPSVSVSNNNNVIQINTNDSNFSVVPGSVIFIVGDRPRVVTSGDTVNRTLTLAIAYTGNDIIEKSATLIPLGQNDALLSAITSLTQAQNGLAEAYGDGPGSVSELRWSVIIDPPPTATQWPTWTQVQGDINEVLPETATRWPSFPEIGGKVSFEQLPDNIDTDNKRTQALSPPIKREQSLTQRLSDYPTLKKTEVRPTESPNNKRLIQFDDVRGEVHVALTDRWFTIPTTIASRSFPIFYRGLILRFNNNSSYTGNIKMRVYPMGTGGLGLPNNPTLANHQWHEYETSVTNLYKIGEFSSEYFEGIIEYIELDNGWHQFDVNQSDVGSLNAKFDTAFGTLRSPFRTFYQKADGYWYSEDMFPENLHSIGASWAQDSQNPRVFTVTEATGSTDALRFFGDSYDDFQFEMVLKVSYVSGTLALTVSNSDPNKVYYQGPARFITDERIYFKRAGSSTTAALTVESIKMRIPHYG